MVPLRRDFLPSDLLVETQSSQVEGVVSVQARQSIEETRWLLDQSNNLSWIEGVVGWLPLVSPNIRTVMEQFSHERKLVGLRHVVQDEPDDGFLSRPDFNLGMQAMLEFGWTYDLLIYGRQLPFAIPFVDRHPQQMFVLDHIAKPSILPDVWDAEWAKNLNELAKRPNVACKFSGVVTEVQAARWDLQQIRPYWETALNAFGASRLMFGTDWPVCLLKAKYTEWVSAVDELASELSSAEKADFWSNNAIKSYRLRSS
jgi:L-fuconolactonase